MLSARTVSTGRAELFFGTVLPRLQREFFALGNIYCAVDFSAPRRYCGPSVASTPVSGASMWKAVDLD